MKFSDIEQEQWNELQPFLDTCLLPLTGLTGLETPWEVTEALERLRDTMAVIELPFKGRIVTYPAVQYKHSVELLIDHVNALCNSIKGAGFRYVVVITADADLANVSFDKADLFIAMNDVNTQADESVTLVENMWKLEV